MRFRASLAWFIFLLSRSFVDIAIGYANFIISSTMSNKNHLACSFVLSFLSKTLVVMSLSSVEFKCLSTLTFLNICVLVSDYVTVTECLWLLWYTSAHERSKSSVICQNTLFCIPCTASRIPRSITASKRYEYMTTYFVFISVIDYFSTIYAVKSFTYCKNYTI